ncbi:MAG: 30S ribosomal protein S6e [Conexivisphaerales archaeon]
MPEFLLVLSDPKTRKSVKMNIQDPKSQLFLGLKIGDTADASSIGIPAKIKITGGSDKSGIPMRYDVSGTGKRAVLLSEPPGIRPATKGYRKRKLVRGNTISPEIYQINAVVVEGNLPEVAAEQPAEAKQQKKAK